MTELQLNEAVASVTGEALDIIEAMGFSEWHPDDEVSDDMLLVLDCPFCGTTVLLSTTGPEELPEIAECSRCETIFDYENADVYEIDLTEIAKPEPRTYLPAA